MLISPNVIELIFSNRGESRDCRRIFPRAWGDGRSPDADVTRGSADGPIDVPSRRVDACVCGLFQIGFQANAQKERAVVAQRPPFSRLLLCRFRELVRLLERWKTYLCIQGRVLSMLLLLCYRGLKPSSPSSKRCPSNANVVEHARIARHSALVNVFCSHLGRAEFHPSDNNPKSRFYGRGADSDQRTTPLKDVEINR